MKCSPLSEGSDMLFKNDSSGNINLNEWCQFERFNLYCWQDGIRLKNENYQDFYLKRKNGQIVVRSESADERDNGRGWNFRQSIHIRLAWLQVSIHKVRVWLLNLDVPSLMQTLLLLYGQVLYSSWCCNLLAGRTSVLSFKESSIIAWY